MHQIAIIGAGGHARECLETARAMGLEVVCLFDDDRMLWDTEVLGAPVRTGGLDAVSDLDRNTALVIGVGDNARRRDIAGRFEGRSFATLVHPFAWVSPSAELAEGAVVHPGAVVQAEARIGRHAILNTSASASHGVVIGDFAHIAVGARLAGIVTVGQGALVGAGVAARPGARIGDWATVGAGAAVIGDVADGVTAYGEGRARPR
ncbi:acetyltransferase [Minwuia thermotolerans]|uniref:Transferase n=1 Tax=Minwuia thermotolerans TaxID=2056226 RepID=A0A2M9FVR4_9PROT|nr:acetyltransferase [Minwuia thermotolerans]PJK27565.1 transferase [Minwuia thermotolerans]